MFLNLREIIIFVFVMLYGRKYFLDKIKDSCKDNIIFKFMIFLHGFICIMIYISTIKILWSVGSVLFELISSVF